QSAKPTNRRPYLSARVTLRYVSTGVMRLTRNAEARTVSGAISDLVHAASSCFRIHFPFDEKRIRKEVSDLPRLHPLAVFIEGVHDIRHGEDRARNRLLELCLHCCQIEPPLIRADDPVRNGVEGFVYRASFRVLFEPAYRLQDPFGKRHGCRETGHEGLDLGVVEDRI